MQYCSKNTTKTGLKNQNKPGKNKLNTGTKRNLCKREAFQCNTAFPLPQTWSKHNTACGIYIVQSEVYSLIKLNAFWELFRSFVEHFTVSVYGIKNETNNLFRSFNLSEASSSDPSAVEHDGGSRSRLSELPSDQDGQVWGQCGRDPEETQTGEWEHWLTVLEAVYDHTDLSVPQH